MSENMSSSLQHNAFCYNKATLSKPNDKNLFGCVRFHKYPDDIRTDGRTGERTKS